MDTKIANAVSGYLETLYDVNVKLIKLCGIDATRPYEYHTKLVLEIIQDIFRVFPCTVNKKKDELIIDKNGGLLEFGVAFEYLENDFSNILKKYYNFLKNIKTIRNKYEHKMHAVKILGEGDGNIILFDFDFVVEGKTITVSAKELIAILLELNVVYSKIQTDVDFYAQDNGKAFYGYYNRLRRFNFNDFEKIYTDSNLRLIGKLMYAF